MRNIFSSSTNSGRYQTQEVQPSKNGQDPVWDRLARLKGYDLDAWRAVSLALIGAGAGSLIGLAAVKKPLGSLTIFDGDIVELSNLPRQYYAAKQVFANKALALAQNLSREALGTTAIEGVPHMFQAALAQGHPMGFTQVVCLVDNDYACIDAARFFYRRGVPVVFARFNAEAEGGYCFIQESKPGTPCWGCLFPGAVRHPGGARCGVGASIEIVLVTAGLVVWALDSLLGNRPARWRYKEVSLAGYDENEGVRTIPVRPDCPICAPAAADE